MIFEESLIMGERMGSLARVGGSWQQPRKSYERRRGKSPSKLLQPFTTPLLAISPERNP